MKKIKNVFGSVLIYTLFLVSISLVMAVVILNIGAEVFNNIEYQGIVRKLTSNIIYKGNLAFKYNLSLNENGSGEIDDISCPTSISMSGATSSGIISSSLRYGGGTSYCSGTYNTDDVLIYFNEDFTGFTGAIYLGERVSLIAGVGQTNFSDTDNTFISFTPTGLGGIDSIDDNFNNDDYKVTGGSGVYYPDNYEDDDVLARKMIYSYISPGIGYTNIFWNNKKMMNIIQNNSHNNDNLNMKIGEVGTGVLYLDINSPFSIRVVRFDRDSFEDFGELSSVQMIQELDQTARIGYIQNDGSVSTGGIIQTGNEYIFDFTNNDYAVFLSNSSTGTLFFTLKGYTDNGTGVYINPIDDSDSQLIRYFGGDILIDSEKRYLYKQFETISAK
ncbi:hypothetical protein HGA92_02870 [Candidatus Gracilibacteria bacterium]|nr:hypothetical protein [Candidatus Gracilibacteria bacterium]NUJ98359.1 hypothetical protein [Candidatus Gracilibacteria bacterium]NUJ99286.1 hypothetical protein [Candidatus Gracilibacteria bacterium]